MRVLMISADSNILRPGSEVRQRMADYGTLADELDIIVCCLKNAVSDGERSIADNVRVFPTRSAYKIFYVWDVLRMVKNQIKDKVSVKHGLSSGWDLVTAQDPFETGLAAYLAARHLRAKLQLQIHTDFLSPYFTKESVKNFIRVRLAKWLLPKADSVRVVSERIKNSLSNVKCPAFAIPLRQGFGGQEASAGRRLRRAGGFGGQEASAGSQMSKVVVLPIFVDVQKIQTAPITVNLRQKYPQFDFIILMASRLTREKNVGLAIRAMVEVVKTNPKVGLIIVGDGPEKENCQLSTVNCQLSTNIFFEPWTENLPSYYKTADVFLNTSNYEGYGRTLIEAAAAGCPIIATDVGVVGEAINKSNCLVVPIGDAAALAQSVLKLIDDRSFRQGLSQKIKGAVQNLDNKEIYLQKYKQSWHV